jgi:hypothetical protein
MYSDDYDSGDDARRELEDNAMRDLAHKYNAYSFGSHFAASNIARCTAHELARLIEHHATYRGRYTLDDALGESIEERVVVLALGNDQDFLHRPINRNGYIAIRQTLDAACIEFEAVLAAEAAP